MSRQMLIDVLATVLIVIQASGYRYLCLKVASVDMLISMPTSFFSGRSNKNDQIHEGDNPIEQLTNNWYKIPFIPEQNRSHTLYRLLFRLNSNFMFFISLTVLAKNYNSLKQDSLCLPRDPALTTRGLLEEGEYSPRDLLILDNQVATIFVMSCCGSLIVDALVFIISF